MKTKPLYLCVLCIVLSACTSARQQASASIEDELPPCSLPRSEPVLPTVIITPEKEKPGREEGKPAKYQPGALPKNPWIKEPAPTRYDTEPEERVETDPENIA